MTPIQAAAIPPLLEGKDVLGCAQTGTGKTAAFLLPILQHLGTHPVQGKPVIRALVLTPTRELAAQIGESFAAYSQFLNLRHLVMFGGVKQRAQVASLRRGIDVLVATPGRLLDLHQQGFLRFNEVEFFVLDEADRMLDMGFIRDIRKIIAMLPRERQNLLFSATMPSSIVKLASAFLNDPVQVSVDRESTTVEAITQQVMFVDGLDKKRLLYELVSAPEVESAIVFTRTKHRANRVVRDLVRGGINAVAIHGNKSQSSRTRALAGFKAGDIRVLVATDIASRGIDVEGVSHIFNFDLPNISESYVHRIGRTGRAGREGIAIAFCDETETEFLVDIEQLIGKSLEVLDDHPWHHPAAVPVPGRRRKSSQGKGRGNQQSRAANQEKGRGNRPDAGGPSRSGDRPRPPRRRRKPRPR
jgi:ATP-dependent RNA helicase RhlE